MSEMTIGSTRLAGYLVSMLGCGGKWMLPDRDTAQTPDPATLIRIRRELEETGLVELDFDGKLHPTAEFARNAYNLTHVRAALRWETETAQLLFLRGPVDDLILRCSEDLWTLERVRPSAVMHWARELAGDTGKGKLTVMGSAGEIPQVLCLEENGDRSEVLTRALDVYFGGGDQNA